jgi:hypothetical protein
MRLRKEKGEGNLSSIIWLLIFLAVGYAIWNVAPAYMADFAFKDKVNEIARAPSRTPDEKVMDLIMKYVKEERLDTWVQKSQIKISTIETSRRVNVDYEREITILPGWTQVRHFGFQVDQPLVY